MYLLFTDIVVSKLRPSLPSETLEPPWVPEQKADGVLQNQHTEVWDSRDSWRSREICKESRWVAYVNVHVHDTGVPGMWEREREREREREHCSESSTTRRGKWCVWYSISDTDAEACNAQCMYIVPRVYDITWLITICFVVVIWHETCSYCK